MLYLYCNDMSTGECFRSWQEVWDWMAQIIGKRPSRADQAAFRKGRHVQIGSNYYSLLMDSAVEALSA